MSRIRIVVDALVAALHLAVFAAAVASSAEFAETTSGGLLLAVEAIACVAHIAYAVGAWIDDVFRISRNKYKWIEYAVTATMATVAVMCTVEAPPSQLIVIVVMAGISQQSQGYILEQILQEWERAPAQSRLGDSVVVFSAAILLQIGEFVAVGLSADVAWVLPAYIVTYALFGGLAAAVQLAPSARLIAKPEVSEVVYSVVSAVAKIGIFGTEWYYLTGGNPQGVGIAVLVVSALAIAAIVALFRRS